MKHPAVLLALLAIPAVALAILGQTSECTTESCPVEDAVRVLAVAVGIGVLVAMVAAPVRSRLRERACPRCGRGVVKGETDCPHCGFDFHTVGAGS